MTRTTHNSAKHSTGRAVKIVVWTFAVIEAAFLAFAMWRRLHTGGH